MGSLGVHWISNCYADVYLQVQGSDVGPLMRGLGEEIDSF